MRLCKWEELPENMRVEEVRKYYDVLTKKRASLVCKRIFDIVVALLMLIILSPVFLVLAIVIKIDSKGPVLYRQVRVTQYGKEFRIHKFRSMCVGADREGEQVTSAGDIRITGVGKIIRKCRLDETAQLIDVLRGTMTFVGVRPEVPKYIKQYNPEWLATLLLPAGVTNLTSICYKDEDILLGNADDSGTAYIEKVLPEKMKWNLNCLERFNFFLDIKLMFMTLFSMLGRDYHVLIERESESMATVEIKKS